ncbi:transposase [Streptomyces sp. NBC_01381]|uniref:transposase n=1 Tax=Streptomyces sp. NBC_01381 TaxID=2903845 RepID=UPI002254F1B8|nr:transposase [Streptomyces sp. NBC_01381]MCX4666008.1 transposase [Streptomyces sp. NBC_01381]
MARPPALPSEEKVRIVVSVLSKDRTVAEAAREAQVSEQSISNWRRQFLQGGSAAMGGNLISHSTAQREQALSEEVRKLKQALGEAYVELMTWRRTGDYRRVPSGTSR